LNKETDKGISCPGCGRFIKILDEICPYCGAKPKNFPTKLMEEKIEKGYSKKIRNTRYQKKDKHYGIK
jgi:rRNA maturation endonuclease Nob1